MSITIDELIRMARARLVYLSQQRSSAAALGDQPQIELIDADIAATQTTLNKLLTLAE